jgi:hypothetical protein
MRKSLISALAFLMLNSVFAQSKQEKKVAEVFIIERADAFVKGVTPVFVNDLKALNRIENNLDTKKYNYRRYSFIFLGEISDANMVGGSLNSYTQDRKKPVFYYTIVKENGWTVIWVISGHDGF